MTPEEIGSNMPIVFGPDAQFNACPDAGYVTNIAGHTFEIQANGDRLMDGCYLVPAETWKRLKFWVQWSIYWQGWTHLLNAPTENYNHRMNGQLLPTVKIAECIQEIVHYNSGMPPRMT